MPIAPHPPPRAFPPLQYGFADVGLCRRAAANISSHALWNGPALDCEGGFTASNFFSVSQMCLVFQLFYLPFIFTYNHTITFRDARHLARSGVSCCGN